MRQLKKPNFRDATVEFAPKCTGELWTNLSPRQQSEVMLRSYLHNVQQVILPGSVPDDVEELDASIVDAAGDCQIDYLYRNENFVHIVQVKFRGKGKVENTDDFIAFAECLKRLHPTYGRHYKKNEKLREAAADVDWDYDVFRLEYVTLGRGNDEIRTRERLGVSNFDEVPDLNERSELVFLEEKDLNEQYRAALSAEEGIVSEVDIRFEVGTNGNPWLEIANSEDRESYIGVIKAGQIHQLYSKNRLKLFNLNIRNYVGDTSTNKDIARTVKETPEDFFFFNNGISAVVNLPPLFDR